MALVVEHEYVVFLKLSPKDLGDSHDLQTPQ